MQYRNLLRYVGSYSGDDILVWQTLHFIFLKISILNQQFVNVVLMKLNIFYPRFGNRYE